MADAAPIEGSLQSTTVGEVLHGVAAAGRTGLLRFHGAEARLVAFHQGAIYLATSASGPSIHQIVVGSGAAPEAAWTDAGPAARTSGIAATLADDTRVDGERLRAVLYEHIVSTLAELLVPGSERFEFLPEQLHQLGPRFLFPVDEALTEAGRRLEAWRSISDVLPSTGTLVRRSPTLPRGATSVPLTAVEWQVASAMPEQATVAEVIAASGLSAFTVFDVLHRLVRRGLVRPVAEDAAAP
ncbi:MAG TPA: DUF4388 domain-containing protein [Acidimicrobiales bacterium]|nr:DUF4388 domain-containing protein [Acidimicrobiales bacterium]